MTAKEDQGFTLIELLIVVAIISIIAAVAVPNLLSARMAGNETSAIASLKVTTSAQVAYSASCGNGGYAASYEILGRAPGDSGQGFISADLGHAAPVVKSGYVFTLGEGAGSTPGPNDCNGTPTISAYLATAVPQTPGTSGRRGFAVDEANTVWQNSAPAATAPTQPFTRSDTVSPVQ